ncbi:MAG: hypothetical protein OCD01_20430 [Fibrobacterales bacterium]
MNAYSLGIIVTIVLGLTGCDLVENKTCTTVIEKNFCITVNGSDQIPDNLVIERSTSNGIDRLSNFDDYNINCFYESSAVATVNVYRNDSLVATKNDVVTHDSDLCHSRDITIDFSI